MLVLCIVISLKKGERLFADVFLWVHQFIVKKSRGENCMLGHDLLVDVNQLCYCAHHFLLQASRAQILNKATDYINFMRRKNHSHQVTLPEPPLFKRRLASVASLISINPGSVEILGNKFFMKMHAKMFDVFGSDLYQFWSVLTLGLSFELNAVNQDIPKIILNSLLNFNPTLVLIGLQTTGAFWYNQSVVWRKTCKHV